MDVLWPFELGNTENLRLIIEIKVKDVEFEFLVKIESRTHLDQVVQPLQAQLAVAPDDGVGSCRIIAIEFPLRRLRKPETHGTKDKCMLCCAESDEMDKKYGDGKESSKLKRYSFGSLYGKIILFQLHRYEHNFPSKLMFSNLRVG